MTFIKLSHIILNPSYISSIALQANQTYLIRVAQPTVRGFYLGVGGFLSSDENELEVTHPDDCKIITQWVSTHASSLFPSRPSF